MKKILIFAFGLLMLASCSNKEKEEQQRQESIRQADSIAQVLAEEAEKAREDSIQQEKARQDSIEQENQKNEAIKKMVKEFYEGAVIGCNTTKIPWEKGSLSRYCTDSFLSKLKRENEYDDGGYAVWILRGDCQDSDCRDKVSSVSVSGKTATVTYTDCGFTCKTKLFLEEVDGQWKINDCKFVSQSSKNKYE